MMTLHVPYEVFFVVCAAIAIISIAGLFAIKWFISAAGIARAEKLEDRIKATMAQSAHSFEAAITSAFSKFEHMEERILTLEKRLHESAQTFRNLTPATVEAALEKKVHLVAEELVAKYREEARIAQDAFRIYKLWLRALLGGPTDVQKAAAEGFPPNLPADLVTLLELFCDQRRIRVKGRNRNGGNPPSANGPII